VINGRTIDLHPLAASSGREYGMFGLEAYLEPKAIPGGSTK
jgi:hypothetical protein